MEAGHLWVSAEYLEASYMWVSGSSSLNCKHIWKFVTSEYRAFDELLDILKDRMTGVRYLEVIRKCGFRILYHLEGQLGRNLEGSLVEDTIWL